MLAQGPTSPDELCETGVAITAPLQLSLYLWQREALTAWRSSDRRGIVEAVTGTGKTRVGIAAIAEAHGAGLKSVVLVPSVALLDQWVRAIKALLPELVVGRWGNGHHTPLSDCDVVVAVVNSAVKHPREIRRLVGLLVADECHHYGAARHSNALVATRWRLGLTATLERSDQGVSRVLLPYFDNVVYRMGYDRALLADVVSEFEVDLVAVAFASSASRRQYESFTDDMEAARSSLIQRFGYPRDPASFLAQVTGGSAGWQSMEGRLGRDYLAAFHGRRELLAREPGKLRALQGLAADIRASGRCLVFTQTKEAAELVAVTLRRVGVVAEAIHSGHSARERRRLIAQFDSGEVQALVAPQVLDEGVDLPDADLGIVVAASRSKRQMIQRMGRILRRRPDGRPARFVILYVEGTGEDPATGAHEAFLDEVLPYARRVNRPQPPAS